MEYKFEEEQEEIKDMLRKIKVISILLTGKDLVPIKPTPEFTKKLIYNLWKVIPSESLIQEYEEYYICDNLYIEEEKVVARIDEDLINSVSKDVTTEKVLYTLFNVTLPELFPEYKNELSHCYSILISSKPSKGIDIFFNILNRSIKDYELEIDTEEIKKAEEEIKKASNYNYLDFIEEFSQIVIDLLWDYIDSEDVYSLVNDSVDDAMDSYLEYLKKRINSVSNNITVEIEYTDGGEIRIVFSSPYDFFKPNFTHLFYEVEDTLDDYIDTLKEKFEEVASIEEVLDEFSIGSPYYNFYFLLPISEIVEMFSKEEPINEEEMMDILTELIINAGDYVDEVYPTELSLKLCDLLKEIKRGE